MTTQKKTLSNWFTMQETIGHHIRNHRLPYKKPSVTCIVTDGFLYGDQLGTKSPKGQKLHYKSIL